MNIANFTSAKGLRRMMPSIISGDGNGIRDLWDKLAPLPLGKTIFSRALGRIAPYTGTIGADVVELRKGYASVVLRDRPGIRNHLRSVHAIALANLAELCGNLALFYSLADDARFIVTRIAVDYVKKARGTLVASCTCPRDVTSARQEYTLCVETKDDHGDIVTRAEIYSLVSPKKEGPTRS